MSQSSSAEHSSNNSTSSSEESYPDDEEIAELGLRPYLWEPEMEISSGSGSSNGEGNEIEDEQQYNRLENNDWCTCGNCQIMDRAGECVCCKEIDKILDTCLLVVAEGENDEPPPCITQHPGFLPVCTNTYVLRTAWSQYKQQYSDAYEGPQHKQFRHIAYRQLVRWCWGLLGKEIRVVLPSCAVMCIRQHFPPPGLEDNFVFEGFHYADE